MIDLLAECHRLLGGLHYVTTPVPQRTAVAFEGLTVLGFVVVYSAPADLLQRWKGDSRALLTDHQLSLRRAQAKAWNTYTVFLTSAVPTDIERIALSAIEEDLTGTRKIARAGIDDVHGLQIALLPLLPIQNAPHLDAVDMSAEIKLRTTELPASVVDAFLSGAPETIVAQVLEEYA